MFYVYVLFSYKDNKLYTGFSTNLKQRIRQHKAGLVFATKSRLPVELLYYEAYFAKEDATKRELFLKSGRGRELIKSLIENSLLRVSQTSV